MAETSQIARMAQKISDDIFAQFLWTKIGPIDQNWLCQKEEHAPETHPTDVVFWYAEPYQEVVTYVQCDLKSYAADSISIAKLKKALVSLSQQISCAEVSEEWQSKYTHKTGNYDIVGLLFVYNHDGGFDRAFSDVLERIRVDEFEIPLSGRMFVLGPREIHWLNNVAQDLMKLRGNSRLPPLAACSFFYPQAVRLPQLREGESSAATLEMLTGPWIILRYSDQARSRAGVLIYYRQTGETVEEFLYLIDFLRQHELLSQALAVEVRTLDGSKMSLINFQKAKQTYLISFDQHARQSALFERIEAIEMSVISNIISSFSEEQIGMEYAR